MIFGLENSKFIADSVEVNIPYSVLDPSFVIPDLVEQVSVCTGLRQFIVRNTYAEFSVIVHLWKYTDPKTSYEQIKSYSGTNVYFFPHKDLSSLKNIYGEDVLCNLYSIECYYLNDTSFYDILKLKFRAVETIGYFGEALILGYGFDYGHYYGGQL